MHGRVESQALIGPVGERRRQDEMCRTRHRQELGYPLDQGQDDDLDEARLHGVRQAASSKRMACNSTNTRRSFGAIRK